MEKIMIVDDDPMTLKILSKIIGDHGFSVVTVQDPTLTVGTLQDNPETFIIFLDIMMPEVDGFSVAKSIRSTSIGKQLKICFLSSKGDKESVMTAIQSGATDFLVKPIDKEKILQKINSFQGLTNDGFAKLTVKLRAEIRDNDLMPEIAVIQLSESGLIIRSSCGIKNSANIHLDIPFLNNLTGLEQPFSLRIRDCKRQNKAVYFITTDFIGISETVVQKIRGAVIQAKYLSG